MRSLVPVCAIGILATAGAGCTNALYFYETGKVSLTVEGRPDSTQPVQGSLGFKQRTAVVVPPTWIGSGADSVLGDSGAMISSFRFGNTKAKGIDIHTALLTGQAASCLDPHEAAAAARAVAAAPPIPTWVENAKTGIAAARNHGKLARLQALAAVPWAALSKEERAELGRITDSGSENYNAELHAAIADELGV